MILTRWAAACTLLLVTIVGCQKTTKDADTTAPIPTSNEKVASVKARYAAIPGVLVGEVEAVKEGYASVEGLDPKLVGKDDVLTFVDVETNQVFSNGTAYGAGLSGRLVVEYDQQGTRPPKKGDLCVKLNPK